MQSFSMPKPKLTPIKSNKKRNLKGTIQVKQETSTNFSDMEVDIEPLMEVNIENKENIQEEVKLEKIEEKSQQTEIFDDDYDISQVDFESPIKNEQSNCKDEITEEQLLKGWETMQETTTNNPQITEYIDASKLPFTTDEEGKKVYFFQMKFFLFTFVVLFRYLGFFGGMHMRIKLLNLA